MDIDQDAGSGSLADVDDLAGDLGRHAVRQAARQDKQVTGGTVGTDVIQEAFRLGSRDGRTRLVEDGGPLGLGSTTMKQTRVPAAMVVWRSMTPSARIISRSASPICPPRNP